MIPPKTTGIYLEDMGVTLSNQLCCHAKDHRWHDGCNPQVYQSYRTANRIANAHTSICLIIFVYFPFLVLKEIYHYWTFLFRGLKQMEPYPQHRVHSCLSWYDRVSCQPLTKKEVFAMDTMGFQHTLQQSGDLE